MNPIKKEKRNEYDICADILKIAKGGAKKSHLVGKGNLNFNIIKKYISRLLGNGLMERIEYGYLTTERGRDFLEAYRALTDCMYPDKTLYPEQVSPYQSARVGA